MKKKQSPYQRASFDEPESYEFIRGSMPISHSPKHNVALKLQQQSLSLYRKENIF